MVQQPGRNDWFTRLTHSGMHWVSRLVAIGLMSWSALSVYEVFSLEGDGGLRHLLNVIATVCIVLLGFFVLRGLAHRIGANMSKAPHVLVAILYLIFEGYCILHGTSGASAPGSWLFGFHERLVSVRPFVVMVVPGFAVTLALMDVVLSREKGALPQTVAPGSRPASMGNGGMMTKNPNPANWPNASMVNQGGGSANPWNAATVKGNASSPAKAAMQQQFQAMTNGQQNNP